MNRESNSRFRLGTSTNDTGCLKGPTGEIGWYMSQEVRSSLELLEIGGHEHSGFVPAEGCASG
jgi:hypothetical protein